MCSYRWVKARGSKTTAMFRIPNEAKQTRASVKMTTYRCFVLIIGAEPLQLGDFLVRRLVRHDRRRRMNTLLLLVLLSVSSRVLGGDGVVEGVIVMMVQLKSGVRKLGWWEGGRGGGLLRR